MRREILRCYPTWYLNLLGMAHYLSGQYEEAEQVLKLALKREPSYTDCRLKLANVYSAQGRTEEARREAEEVMRRDPNYRLKNYETSLAIVKDRELVSRFLDMLRQLGLQ